jgi:hypothetical protein
VHLRLLLKVHFLDLSIVEMEGATNHLGGIGDLLEDEGRRSALAHIGQFVTVAPKARVRPMCRVAGILLLGLVLVIPVPAVAADGAPIIASWKAALGSSGSAALVTDATGAGTFGLVAKGLVARAGYRVDIRRRSCVGLPIAASGTTAASSTGRISRSFRITARGDPDRRRRPDDPPGLGPLLDPPRVRRCRGLGAGRR